MSVNSKMTAIANAIRSLLGIAGSLSLDAMATRLNGIAKKTAATYTPGTADQTIAAGQYLTGAQIIKGDANLLPANIAKDVTIFGVAGEHEGGGGAETYESCTVTISGCCNGWVSYQRLRNGVPTVWLSQIISSTTISVIKGTVAHVYAGGNTISRTGSTGLLLWSSATSAVSTLGGTFEVLETAGDTESFSVTLD